MQFLLAQISDLHITAPPDLLGGFLDTGPFLTAAVQHLNALVPAPDLVLMSGDLVNNGHPDEYARLAALIAPLRPQFVLLAGNHDDPPSLRAAFPGQPWEAGTPMLRGVVDGALRVVLLDSVVPDQPGGRVGDEQLAWLDRVLTAAPRQPTVVAVHHPPFATGIEHMDEMGLADGPATCTGRSRHAGPERSP
jgi:Icc protein